MYSAAASRDLHVRSAGGTKLLLLISRATEYRMSVRIDESGSEHGTGAIDLARIRELSTEIFLRAGGGDAFVIDANYPSFLNTGVGHLTTFARAGRSSACRDL